MHCETLSDSGKQISPRRDVEFTITFDDIRMNDKVVISTMNSEYRFAVIDPSSHKGMLSGGSLGDRKSVV